MKRLIRIVLRLVLAAFVLALAAALWLIHGPGSRLPTSRPVEAFVDLEQGWSTAPGGARQVFAETPSGASLGGLRYDWLLHLELPWGRERLLTPDRMRAWGFVVEAQPTASNPGQLPVGFTRRYDPELREAVLDISCAACHTGQLLVERNGRLTAIRVDGGGASHDLGTFSSGRFVPTLTASLAGTYLNPLKFRRFGQAVLGERYAAGSSRLHADLGRVLRQLLAEGWAERRRRVVEDGPGRTDLLARIAHSAFSEALAGSNDVAADAPVRYPALWNAWKADRVRAAASASQPMALAVSHAVGSGARLDLLDAYERPVPAGERYRSTVQVEGLRRVLSALQQLEPPHWPEAVLGAVDMTRAERGRGLFAQHCAGCHAADPAGPTQVRLESPLRGAADPLWPVTAVAATVVGTDPAAATASAQRTVDLSAAGLSADELRAALRPALDEYRRRLAGMAMPEAPAASATMTKPATSAAASTTTAGASTTTPPASVEGAAPSLATPAPRPAASTTPAESAPRLAPDVAVLETARRRLTTLEQQLAGLDVRRVPLPIALAAVTALTRAQHDAQRRLTPEQRACVDGFGALDLPVLEAAYVARPLAGIWASPPFLHNGSVPTLYQLLSPQDERDTRFYVSPGAFDPVQVGLDTSRKQGEGFWFDTSLPGNTNVGHEFRAGYTGASDPRDPQYGVIGPALSPEDRRDLIEYLKIHRDPETPPGRVPPDCGLAGEER